MVRQTLVKAVNIVKQGASLDIGAEKGLDSVFLIERGFEVTAVDISAKNCKKIEAASSSIKVINQDIKQFKFGRKYDLINCGFVLHFLKKDARDFIKKIQEHTAKSGVNVLAVFLDRGEFNLHEGFLGQGELRNIYEGWKEISYHETFIPTREKNPDGSVKKQMAAFAVFQKVA